MGWVSDILSGDWTDATEADQGNDPGSQNGTSDEE